LKETAGVGSAGCSGIQKELPVDVLQAVQAFERSCQWQVL
jgi:hypothetical protein